MENSDPSYYECEWCKEWFPIPAALNHPDCPQYHIIKARTTTEASKHVQQVYGIGAKIFQIHIDDLLIKDILNTNGQQ